MPGVNLMFKKTYLVMVALLGLGLLVTAGTVVSANNGAEEMLLNGGKRGKVPFPHRSHQDVLKDCKKCHDLFPQEPGVIDRFKKAGDLKKKQVMNTRCVKCHKAMKKGGNKAGPTTCSKCHIREKK
jgi:hypothetical protein